MNRDFSFPPSRRLLSSSQYQRVFDHREFRISRKVLLVLVCPNNLGHGRLGMVISKKTVPKAHCRNRVRRIIRESYRYHQQLLSDLDIIILSRRGIGEADNEPLFGILAEVWKDLILRIDAARTAKD